ncbi:MAG TPA: DUF2459 domain-containing protein [Steroidobacteraceae bacterium]|nr:DUF2459 domain-containing protein [Steroidobacteraceae bacterium]
MSGLRAKVAVLLAALALSACATVPQLPAPTDPHPVTGPLTAVFVVKRGWHTDIGFAVPDISAPLAATRSAFPAARYVLFGFGDRHYLLTHGRKFAALFGAIWPGRAVVLVTTLEASPEAAFGDQHVIRLMVPPEQQERLQAFIWKSVESSAGSPQSLGPGPYAGSAYYAATEGYSGLHTCNTWTAEGLAAAGLAVHSRGVEFAGQVWHQVRRLAAHQQGSAGGKAQPHALPP